MFQRTQCSTGNLWWAVLARSLLLGALLAACCRAPAAEDEPMDETEQTAEEAQRLRAQIDSTLEEFSLSIPGTEDTPLEGREILRWDNNARGSEQGVTLLYLAHGRPEAVCCVYPWNGSLAHWFSTMSRGLVEARQDGAIVWQPDRPGVEFNAIPEAPAPQDSPAGRLRQLKALAGRFSGKLVGWANDNSDQQELRMLPRPVYRYEQPQGELVDGAVFALAMGVDPEALLVIEALDVDGSRRWEYAFVRRTSGQLEGRLDGAVVWTADRAPPEHELHGLDRSFVLPLDVDAPMAAEPAAP
jgi:hypothetical protein